MPGKIGNKNAAKSAENKTRVRQITLREHEREFFTKLADGEGLTHGIRRAYEMLSDEKLLIAAADASGAARTLTGVETDGTRTALVARKGLQLAVRNGEKVKIPKHVRLACCALSMGITDYHGPEAAEQAEREVEVKQRRPKKAGSTGPAAGGAEPGVGLE